MDMKHEFEKAFINEEEGAEAQQEHVTIGEVGSEAGAATVPGEGSGYGLGEDTQHTQVIVARLIQITEVAEPETETPSNQNQVDQYQPKEAEQIVAPPAPPANPTLACLICCTSFRKSVAFSKKNKLTSSDCTKVWKVFCRLLSPQLAPPSPSSTSAREFSFEKYPLPFCTNCAKNVIGLTKMQEELELLQSTIDFGMKEIRATIKSTDICSVKLDFEEYADKIEDIRSYVLREPESKPARKALKANAPSSVDNEIAIEEEDDVEDSLKYDPLNLYSMGASPVKRPRKSTPLAESIPVTLEPSQIKESERFTIIHESLEEIGEVTRELDDDDKPEKTDSKFEALATQLSVSTRKSILQKRQKELKRKAVSEKKRDPFGHVIDMKDGRFLFGNVIISQEEVNGVNKYKCEFCGARLKNLGLMRRHIRQAHKNGNKNEYNCKICGKKLTNIGSVPRHMAAFHSGTAQQQFPCELCGKMLNTARTLDCHQALVHGIGMEKYRMCDICGRPFRSERNVKQHRLTHMNADEMAEFSQAQMQNVDASLRIFDCEYCGKRLSCLSTLRQHMMIHEEVMPFTCDVCGWNFRHKCNLQAHLQLHHPGEDQDLVSFKCDFPECGKTYPNKYQLSKHSVSHRSPEDKPFKCVHPGCNMGFPRMYDLKNHRRTHTGERPYKCSMCPRTFSRSHHLSRHVLKLHNPNAEPTDTELITAELIEPTSNMTIEFVITGAEGETFTLPHLNL